MFLDALETYGVRGAFEDIERVKSLKRRKNKDFSSYFFLYRRGELKRCFGRDKIEFLEALYATEVGQSKTNRRKRYWWGCYETFFFILSLVIY